MVPNLVEGAGFKTNPPQNFKIISILPRSIQIMIYSQMHP